MHDRYDRVFRQQSNIGKWYNDGRKQLTMGAQKILWRNSGTHSRKVLRRTQDAAGTNSMIIVVCLKIIVYEVTKGWTHGGNHGGNQ